ncbi:MAG: branched-chain amino acid ABC transporter ATPase [Armatimonadetes bacterium CSP1-3]|nr:MAG: branched-chain amino acid ABC transporter ATPase [Armatimonadetes bacterium CSP1-3]
MLLTLTQVVAGYLSGVHVLQGVTLHVDPGEVVCLIGPNGAGKSTVLRAISGLLRPTQGEITLPARTSRGCGPTWCCAAASRTCPKGTAPSRT